MERPFAVKTLFGYEVIIDASAIVRVDIRWAGGKFGVRIDFNNENFILVPASEASALQRAGVIPAG
jgi:hypothetical protein